MKKKTLTLKISEHLEAKLNSVSRKNGQSRSETVRRALDQYFLSDDRAFPGTVLDLSGDLAGCIQGPPDLSWKKSYLEGYGE